MLRDCRRGRRAFCFRLVDIIKRFSNVFCTALKHNSSNKRYDLVPIYLLYLTFRFSDVVLCEQNGVLVLACYWQRSVCDR